MLFTFQQLRLLVSGLTTDLRRGTALGAFSLSSLERVKSPPDRLAVDAELSGEVCEVLAGMNATAYPLDLPIEEFGCRSHLDSLLRRDISRDISTGS
jgi:hypothetical protein